MLRLLVSVPGGHLLQQIRLWGYSLSGQVSVWMSLLPVPFLYSVVESVYLKSVFKEDGALNIKHRTLNFIQNYAYCCCVNDFDHNLKITSKNRLPSIASTLSEQYVIQTAST